METIELCIIGMGISGIAVARHATLEKIPFIALEKEASPVGIWRYKSYPTIELQTSRYDYCFEDEPMINCSRDYPNRQDIIDYFEGLIAKYDINSHVYYNSSVLKCIPRISGNASFPFHLVKYETPRGVRWIRCRYLSICSGFYTEPKWPDDVHFDSFTGNVCHVNDFAMNKPNNDHFFTEKNVVVLGNGPSGCDMASYAKSRGAKSVTLLYRSPRWIYPRKICGIGSFFLINRWTITLARCLPIWFVVIMLKILFKITYLIMGIPIRIPLPYQGISRDNFAINTSFLELLSNPKSKVSYHQISSNTTSIAKKHTFTYQKKEDNGKSLTTSIPCDTVVCATGYQQSVSFLSKKHSPLYRRIIPIQDYSISYIGFSASFNWARVADRQARWWIKAIQGKIIIPNVNQQHRDIYLKKTINNQRKLDYEDLSYEVYQYLDILERDESLWVKH